MAALEEMFYAARKSWEQAESDLAGAKRDGMDSFGRLPKQYGKPHKILVYGKADIPMLEARARACRERYEQVAATWQQVCKVEGSF